MRAGARTALVTAFGILGARLRPRSTDIELQLAFLKASKETQDWIRGFFRGMGVAPPSFFAITRMLSSSSTPVGQLISLNDFRGITDRVQSITGVSSKLLLDFAHLESPTILIGGVPHLNPHVVNALGYRGLFQFDRKGEAWATASRMAKAGHELPSFPTAWADPFYNTLAAAYYVLSNSAYIRAHGFRGEITMEVAYLMHNQGAGATLQILKGTRTVDTGQSLKAQAIGEMAYNQVEPSSFA
jgi:hypothetical protein